MHVASFFSMRVFHFMFVQLLSPYLFISFFLYSCLFYFIHFISVYCMVLSFYISRFLGELLNMIRDEEGILIWGDSKHLRGPWLRLMKDGWWPLGLPRPGNGNQLVTTLVISGCHLWDTNKARQSGGVLQMRPVLLADRSPKVEKPNPQMLADWFSMTHALRNYSRVSTRLWNNFFWNNFQGIIFEGGRYTIMHVGIWKSWSSPSRYPGIIRFWNNFW